MAHSPPTGIRSDDVDRHAGPSTTLAATSTSDSSSPPPPPPPRRKSSSPPPADAASFVKLPRLLSISANKSPDRPAGLTLATSGGGGGGGGGGDGGGATIISSISDASPFFRVGSSSVPGEGDDDDDDDDDDAAPRLRPNDEVLLINSHRVRNPKIGARMIKAAHPDRPLTLVISRGERTLGMSYVLVRVDVREHRRHTARRRAHRAASPGGRDREGGITDAPDAGKGEGEAHTFGGLHFHIPSPAVRGGRGLARVARVSDAEAGADGGGGGGGMGDAFAKSGLKIGDAILCIDGEVVRGPYDAIRMLEGVVGVGSSGGDEDYGVDDDRAASRFHPRDTGDGGGSRASSGGNNDTRVVVLLVYSPWEMRREILREALRSKVDGRWRVEYSSHGGNQRSSSASNDTERGEVEGYIILRLADTTVSFRLDFDVDGTCSCREPFGSLRRACSSPNECQLRRGGGEEDDDDTTRDSASRHSRREMRATFELLYRECIKPAIEVLNYRTLRHLRLLEDAVCAADDAAGTMAMEKGGAERKTHIDDPDEERCDSVATIAPESNCTESITDNATGTLSSNNGGVEPKIHEDDLDEQRCESFVNSQTNRLEATRKLSRKPRSGLNDQDGFIKRPGIERRPRAIANSTSCLSMAKTTDRRRYDHQQIANDAMCDNSPELNPNRVANKTPPFARRRSDPFAKKGSDLFARKGSVDTARSNGFHSKKLTDDKRQITPIDRARTKVLSGMYPTQVISAPFAECKPHQDDPDEERCDSVVTIEPQSVCSVAAKEKGGAERKTHIDDPDEERCDSVATIEPESNCTESITDNATGSLASNNGDVEPKIHEDDLDEQRCESVATSQTNRIETTRKLSRNPRSRSNDQDGFVKRPGIERRPRAIANSTSCPTIVNNTDRRRYAHQRIANDAMCDDSPELNPNRVANETPPFARKRTDPITRKGSEPFAKKGSIDTARSNGFPGKVLHDENLQITTIDDSKKDLQWSGVHLTHGIKLPQHNDSDDIASAMNDIGYEVSLHLNPKNRIINEPTPLASMESNDTARPNGFLGRNTHGENRQIMPIEETNKDMLKSGVHPTQEIYVPQHNDIDDSVSAISMLTFMKATRLNRRRPVIQRRPSMVPTDSWKQSLPRTSHSDSDNDSSSSTTNSSDSDDSESSGAESSDEDEDEISNPQSHHPRGEQTLVSSDRSGGRSPKHRHRGEGEIVENNPEVAKAGRNIHPELAPAKPLTKRLKMRIGDVSKTYKVLHHIIGTGAFGTVRSCVHRSTREKYAVKSITKKGNIKNAILLKNEIAIVQRVNHRHVVKILDVIQDVQYIHIVMEECLGGDLFDKIVNNGVNLTEDRACEIIGSLLDAMAYLHERDIVHRDLKPEHIMLSEDDINSPIKIIDFGLATIHGLNDPPMTALAGSAFTLAPEVLKRSYGRECDLWSVGVIAYFLLTSQVPFNAKSDQEIFAKIINGTFAFPPWAKTGLTDMAKDFMRKLIVVDPKQRMTAKRALSHPWIRGRMIA